MGVVVRAAQGGLLAGGDAAEVLLWQARAHEQLGGIDDLHRAGAAARHLADLHVAHGDHAGERGHEAGVGLGGARLGEPQPRLVEVEARIGHLARAHGPLAEQGVELGERGFEVAHLVGRPLGAALGGLVADHDEDVALADPIADLHAHVEHATGRRRDEVGAGASLDRARRFEHLVDAANGGLRSRDHGRRHLARALALVLGVVGLPGAPDDGRTQHEQPRCHRCPHEASCRPSRARAPYCVLPVPDRETFGAVRGSKPAVTDRGR